MLILRPLRAVAIAVAALLGAWFLSSEYLKLHRLSAWYENTRVLAASPSQPDYDLASLPWQTVSPRMFDVQQGTLTLVTSAEPYGYQAFATIDAKGANTAGITFDANVESGGVTIGILQAGEWIAVNSSQTTGAFAEINSALLGFRKSLTVMIANKNPAGESRVTIKSLRLYLQH
jgi:hypothetical protein